MRGTGRGVAAGFARFTTRLTFALGLLALVPHPAPAQHNPDRIVVIDTAGAFADWRRPMGSITFDVGGRLDVASSDVDEAIANTNLYFAYQGTRSLHHVDVLPAGRMRLAWQSGPWQVSAGLGHTARVAEANERFFALQRMGTDWVGNPGLAPVRNTGVEGTASWAKGGATIAFQAFANHLDGYIAVYDQARRSAVAGVMNAKARSYANVDARTAGIEANLTLPVSSRLFLSSDLSYVRGTQEGDALRGITAGPLAEMPALRGRVRLRFDNARWFVAAEEVVTGDQRRVDAELGEQPPAGAAVTNVTAGIRWRYLAVTVGVTNLFDRLYTDALSYQRDPFRIGVRLPEPGRQWFVTALWRF